jgi:hypothetical protein
MTPTIKPRKLEAVKTLSGEIHIALGLGLVRKPVVLILIEGGSK